MFPIKASKPHIIIISPGNLLKIATNIPSHSNSILIIHHTAVILQTLEIARCSGIFFMLILPQIRIINVNIVHIS